LTIVFKKVLVANRGEIALRVIRACRELGLATVAVYSDADRSAAHVGAADEAFHIGPAPASQSYLNTDVLLDTAARSGCDAVHPGYGFMAENAAFARRCEKAGVTFIGPSPDAIDRMGNKIAARSVAHAAGVPVVPGTIEPVTGPDAVRDWAEHVGYPIAIKAAAGGGGKGLKIARSPEEVDAAVSVAAKEAAAYFKDDTLYVERYLERPKHVEVQVLGDKHGHVVHLGERDCSMQRRHQKLVEETPARILPTVRSRLLAAAVKLCEAIGYDSAGTIECLVEGDEFYFLEMNTRIQVEHTITEMTYGFDLVKAQIRVAAGEPLWVSQGQLSARGHAIEVRVNAESPARDFRPCAGTLTRYLEPGGPGVRVDAAAFAGWTIPQEYDSLLAKLIVWGQDRDEARARLRRALAEFRVEGVDTTIPFFRLLIDDDEFRRGDYTTPTVERFASQNADALAAAYPESADGEPRVFADAAQEIDVEVNDKRFTVKVYGLGNAQLEETAAGRRTGRFKSPKKIAPDGKRVVAPMHGLIAEIKVAPGDQVTDGQVVAVVEAMKMMNEVVAQRAGTILSVDVKSGDTVEMGASIVSFA
jgi:acetyl-CoA/propionyl-CoA carboxylase biotin carboxyl carrier protein